MIRRANPQDQPLLECETARVGGPGADVEMHPSHRLSNHQRPQPTHHYGPEKLIWTDDDVVVTPLLDKRTPVYRRRRPGRETEILGYLDMRRHALHWTPGPNIEGTGSVTRSVNYPADAVNAALHDWYARNGYPTGGRVYRSQDHSLDAFIQPPIAETNTTPDDEGDTDLWPDDIKEDWQYYMEVLDEKTEDPQTVHEQQTGLRDFRTVTQADVNPDSISQSDDRLASLPAFLDDDEYEEVSKYTPGTGGPLQCDHCNEEDWHSHPLESGVDALRPGGITHGDPNHDPCHADEIKGCGCCGCPRCNVRSIEFRKQSQDYRCNGCDLKFSHPVARQSEGERDCLYWQCGECGMATQAAFAGVPEDLLDAAPQAVFDTDD